MKVYPIIYEPFGDIPTCDRVACTKEEAERVIALLRTANSFNPKQAEWHYSVAELAVDCSPTKEDLS